MKYPFVVYSPVIHRHTMTCSWQRVSSSIPALRKAPAASSSFRSKVSISNSYKAPSTYVKQFSSYRLLTTTSFTGQYNGVEYPGDTSGRDYGQDQVLDIARLSDPRTIVKHLDDYIIGQNRAKKILAVAIYNHYNRVRANLLIQEQQQKETLPPSVHMLSSPNNPVSTINSSSTSSTSLSSSAPTSASASSTNVGNSTPTLIHPASSQPNVSKEGQATATVNNISDPHRTEHHHSTLPHDYYSSSNHESPGSLSTGLSPPERLLPFGSQRRASWLNPPTQANSNTLSSDHSFAYKSDSDRQDMVVHDKSNVLLIGPTGSGKTLLARTLAQILEVPFSSSDATPFTQAGYVGEDVDLVIHRLLQACDYDVKRAETGIVFIDEIDKISRRSDSASGSRDVSGEGVQQSLLRMLEGTVVNIVDKSGNAPSHRRSNNGNVPLGGNGTISGSVSSGGAKGESYAVDTSNILFILSGAFIGLDKTVKDRIAKGSIGFDAVIRSSSDDMTFQDGKSTLQPLDLVEPADLVQYGLIPEFVGRLPVVANVNSLSKDDLVRVLTEPKNSLLKQYEGLFKLSEVELRFSQAALQKIAELALEKKTGARGLRRIMENVLLDPMFDAPGSNIKQVVIDSQVVEKKKPALYLRTGQTSLGDKMIADDDHLSKASVNSSASPLVAARQQISQG